MALKIYCFAAWRGRLVVYGAALERRFTGNGIEGSNPSPSAKHGIEILLMNDTDAYRQTKLAYEKSAEQLIKHWDNTAVRERDINLIFRLAKKDKPTILELGCGPGRDAAFMVQKASQYSGIDYSSKLIKVAKDRVPEGTFILGDITTAVFPQPVDIIIAFASLIHLNEAQIKLVFEKAATSLSAGGIFYISTKEGTGTVIKSDNFGERTFYLYSLSDLQKFASEHFETVYEGIEHVRSQNWVEVAFKLLPGSPSKKIQT